MAYWSNTNNTDQHDLRIVDLNARNLMSSEVSLFLSEYISVYHMTSLFSSVWRHVIKSVKTTHVSTLAGIHNVIGDVRNDNVNFHSKYVFFECDKILF